jgi:hypothetical protein
MQELEVYSMIGTEGFTRLVAAFYQQVPQDDLLGPMSEQRQCSDERDIRRQREEKSSRDYGCQTFCLLSALFELNRQ